MVAPAARYFFKGNELDRCLCFLYGRRAQMDKFVDVHGCHRFASPFANLDDIARILFEQVNCVKKSLSLSKISFREVKLYMLYSN